MSEKGVNFRTIKEFVSADLQVLFFGCLKDAAGGAGLSPPDPFDSKEDDGEPFIPLILCDERSSIQRKGIFCPYEFIVERNDLIPQVDDKGVFVSNPESILASRLLTLASLYGGKDFRDEMRDWFAGAFRMYLMLDTSTHGTSEFVDLEKAKNGKDPILTALAWTGFSDEDTIKHRCRDLISEGEHVDNDEDIEAKVAAVLNHRTFIKNRFSVSTDRLDELSDSAGDSLLQFKALAKVLYSDYFEPWESEDKKVEKVGRSVVRALELDSPEDRLEALCDIYCDRERRAKASVEQTDECKFERIPVKDGKPVFIGPREHAERLPVAFGDRAKYVTPSGKLNLLLIDDNVDGSPFGHLATEEEPHRFASTISKDDWRLLRDLFNVQPLQISKDSGDACEAAAQCFRRFQEVGLTFDLILVDLCLGNNERGADLAGYSMIRTVRGFFPGTPVVVYSRFSDMEHIARAFACGAKWFLVKGEEAKLPRHVLKMLKQVGWHREWRAIQNGADRPDWRGDETDPFYQKFLRTPEWQYLTFKSLESFPSRFISVKKMGGGISSAVTFKATKGVRVNGGPLQTPSILKIDTAYNTGMEYERYFRMIRPYIANEAGRVETPERVLNRTFACIVYTFAGKQDSAHELASMGDMLDDDVECQTACDYETYRHALECIFDEILPKIHGVSPELERGDAEGANLQRSELLDAFEWSDEWWRRASRRTSFPNANFGEFKPSEFWKSYLLRLQPWKRIKIDFDQKEDGERKDVAGAWPFGIQETFPSPQKQELEKIKPTRTRLIFHNVMTDPFAASDGKKTGRRLIEAYTTDRKLIWLDGDVSDFVARFRKRVAPGTSLWLKDSKRIDDAADWRLEWLKKTFENNKNDHPSAEVDFVNAIAAFSGIAIKPSETNEALSCYTALQDAIIGIAKKAAEGKAKDWGMKCPVGIVHGDLNVKNIMLESRKHPPKEDDPDVTKTVSDVWLIDFARTRRDLIAHDFNVFFTSVLGELFHERLLFEPSYQKKLRRRFKEIVSAALAPHSGSERGIPDSIRNDRRFTLVYRILRRSHDAALAAGVSQNMYLLTTALACLYTLKIFLNKGCKVQLAAGYFAAAWIGYNLLCKDIGQPNMMDVFHDVSNGRTDSKAASQP